MAFLLVRGRLVEHDTFEALLLRAGLNDSTLLPPREADFTPEDAAELHDLCFPHQVWRLCEGSR
jgi:hypothetical protein